MKAIEQVEALAERAVVLELDGLEMFGYVSMETAAQEYNGIGPEYLDPDMRDSITMKLSLFEPAALIHDLRNYLSDGTRPAFEHANDEFLRNCRKCANAAYPWWSLRRWRARAVAKLMYDFVASKFGWKAWMDCYYKTQNKRQGVKA